MEGVDEGKDEMEPARRASACLDGAAAKNEAAGAGVEGHDQRGGAVDRGGGKGGHSLLEEWEMKKMTRGNGTALVGKRGAGRQRSEERKVSALESNQPRST